MWSRKVCKARICEEDMAIVVVFSKEEQKEIRALKKEDKAGKDINWDAVLSRIMNNGIQRWKRFKP